MKSDTHKKQKQKKQQQKTTYFQSVQENPANVNVGLVTLGHTYTGTHTHITQQADIHIDKPIVILLPAGAWRVKDKITALKVTVRQHGHGELDTEIARA